MKQVNRHLFEGQAEVLLPHIRYLRKEIFRNYSTVACCFAYIVIQVHCSRGFLEIPVTDLNHRERKTNTYMYLTNDNRGFAWQPCGITG